MNFSQQHDSNESFSIVYLPCKWKQFKAQEKQPRKWLCTPLNRRFLAGQGRNQRGGPHKKWNTHFAPRKSLYWAAPETVLYVSIVDFYDIFITSAATETGPQPIYSMERLFSALTFQCPSVDHWSVLQEVGDLFSEGGKLLSCNFAKCEQQINWALKQAGSFCPSSVRTFTICLFNFPPPWVETET